MASTHTARKGGIHFFFEVAGVAPAGLRCPALLPQRQGLAENLTPDTPRLPSSALPSPASLLQL